MPAFASRESGGLFAFVVSMAVLIVVGVLIWNGQASSVAVASSLLVAAVLASSLAPVAGIVAVLMAAPTMYELHVLPWGSFSLLELATLAAAGGTALHVCGWAYRREWGKMRPLVEPAQVVVPVAMLMVATVISLLTIVDPTHRDASLREVRTVILEPILFFCVARLVIQDSRARNLAGGGLIAAGVGIAAYGIGQTLFEVGGVAAGSVMRATGTYPHPNNLAFFLERTLLFSLTVVILRPRWWPVWVLVAIQVAGVASTYSRGAFLAIAAGIAIVLLLRGKYRWLLGVGAAGVVALAGAFIIAPDRLIDAGGSGSEPTRFTIWRAAFQMAKDHPVFGVGPDQFLYQYWRRYVEPMGWPERYTSHPHNLVLDVWLRLGVAGLAAFGMLVIGLIHWSRLRFAEIRDDIWAMGAIAALAGGLAHGMVDNGYFLPDLATVTWFFIAMLLSARQHHAGPENRRESP